MRKFKLGEYWVDTRRCLLKRGHSVVTLEPRVMDVLQYLAEHQGEVVGLKDIYRALWPQSIYNPACVQRCISQLRKAFGDTGVEQNIIKTHPKRGYSLCLEVRPLNLNWLDSGKYSPIFFYQMILMSSIIFIIVLLINGCR